MATKQDQLHPLQKKNICVCEMVWYLYIRNRTLPDTKFLFLCPNIVTILLTNIALDQ